MRRKARLTNLDDNPKEKLDSLFTHCSVMNNPIYIGTTNVRGQVSLESWDSSFEAGDVLLEGDGVCLPAGCGCLEELHLVLLWGDTHCPQEGFPLRPGCILCQEMSLGGL